MQSRCRASTSQRSSYATELNHSSVEEPFEGGETILYLSLLFEYG
jgi:hypothetical protein